VKGICTQLHYPAVAQPFTIFWAPWPLFIIELIACFALLLLLSLTVSMGVGVFAFIIGMPLFHILSVRMGMKMRYCFTIVTSIDNRRKGQTNLARHVKGPVYGNA